MPVLPSRIDCAVVGAGAAGLMTAIQAARAARDEGAPAHILLLDGAQKIGAKILVAGGGRCNVTHHAVDERAFSGSTPASIRRILARFGVDRTVAFFADLGVPLKREEAGKLFPVSDRASTVLDALLSAARVAEVDLRTGFRVEDVRPTGGGFIVRGPTGSIEARRVILATGGKSLPKSGSDGHGFEIARRLGHTTTPRILPGLVPLLLAERCFVRGLSGLTVETELTLHSGEGKRLAIFRGSTLCTHFGISGPPVLDISRHWLHARIDDPHARLTIDWLPGLGEPGLRATLQERTGVAVRTVLRSLLPERLADALVEEARIEREISFERLSREVRANLLRTVCDYELPVTGDRGFTHAEVTAGGVPLSEVRLDSLESRVCPGLHLAGEILDVDGRIGGFNFQWAWASGFVAGSAIGHSLTLR